MGERRTGFSVHGGGEVSFHAALGTTTIPLQPGEEVFRSAHAARVAGDVGGTAVLTNLRFIFQPDPRGIIHGQRAGAMILPLEGITVLGLGRPLLGGAPMLRVGTSLHQDEYFVPDAALWIQDIESLRGGPGAAPAGGAVASTAPPAPVATGIKCPVCGSETIRGADGSLRCPKCTPAAPAEDSGDSLDSG